MASLFTQIIYSNNVFKMSALNTQVSNSQLLHDVSKTAQNILSELRQISTNCDFFDTALDGKAVKFPSTHCHVKCIFVPKNFSQPILQFF